MVQVTPRVRARLVKYGDAVGDKIRELVDPDRHAAHLWRNRTEEPAKKDRPRTAEHTRELILKIARQTGYAYTRILGELKKLGIRSKTRNRELS